MMVKSNIFTILCLTILIFSFNVDNVYFITEWEAAKNADNAKENALQPVTIDTSPATNTQTETFSQVTMMPVQVSVLTNPIHS